MTRVHNSSGWTDGFFSASDGIKLFYRIYCPSVPLQSLVLFHGFGEHSLRYEKFSHHFPDFQIAIFDMRGMGRSEGEPVYIDSFDQYEQDALDFLQFLDKSFSVIHPRTILGHSLGGLNLMRLVVRRQLIADRFIFSAPCFRIAMPAILLGMNGLIELIHSRFLYHNPVYFKNLTHDLDEMLSYKNDPLIMHKMTARLLNEMVLAGRWVEALADVAFQVPVHFLLAGEDKLVKTNIAEQVYKKISAPVKSLNIYKNFYHEIFNESDQLQVFQDLGKILN